MVKMTESRKLRRWAPLLAAPCLMALSACPAPQTGNDAGVTDAGTTPDAGDPAPDAGAPEPDAGDPEPDGGVVEGPTPVVLPLSAAGPDTLYAVTFADDGSIYAAGYSAPDTSATADRSMVLAKLTPAGELDDSFGTNGVATVNVAEGGGAGETARGVVVQSTGKIVIGGSIEHDVTATGTAASDRDMALVRFNADGTVDDTFGEDGIVILDLSTGIEVSSPGAEPTLAGADSFWNLNLAQDDKLVIHGAQRAEGFQAADNTLPRADTDYTLVRLNADGSYDTSFSEDGRFTLDLPTAPEASAGARNATVLADGSIIGGGYTRNATFNNTQQPVVYKVTPAGELDTDFATDGIFHEEVLGSLAEVYSVVAVGDKLVTTGYGRNTQNESIDWLSLRLNADGTLDDTWGDNGAVRVDINGLTDQSRHLVALPDGRPLLFGSGTETDGNTDAMYAILEDDGSFAEGSPQRLDIGGPADFFWGGAVSPGGSTAVLVGLKGAGRGDDVGAANNDDAAILLIPLAD